MPKKLKLKLLIFAAPVLGAALILIFMIAVSSAALCSVTNSHKTVSEISSTSENASAPVANVTGNVKGMPVSNKLIAFIESWEGYYATGYRGLDSWNVTIGYGHVELTGETFTSLTKQEAEQLLLTDLQSQGYIQSVQKEFSGYDLSQNKFDALVDLAYGLGPYIWNSISLTKDIKSNASSSILRRDWDALDYVGTTESIGLRRRRDAEWKIFIQNVYTLNP